VVDNASTDGSAAMVKSKFPQVRLIENKENVGFGRAQNQAIKTAEGRYVMMLNPDAYFPEPGALAAMIKYLDENQDIAAAGPRIMNPNGSLQFSARKYPTIGAGMFRHTILGRLFPKNRYVKNYIMSDWKHDQVREVDWLSGAALMLRKKTVDDIGLLDEGFYMYCEDVDWCYRAGEKGWKKVYFPEAVVIHRIGAASDKAPVRMIYQFHKSMFRFFMKHYARGLNILLIPLVLAGLMVRAFGFILLTRAGAPGKTSKEGWQD
jgi:GT2 family glycosyltransferase